MTSGLPSFARRFTLVLAMVVASAVGPNAVADDILDQLTREATALKPVAPSPLVHDFLSRVGELPSVDKRTLYFDKERKNFYSVAQYSALPSEQQSQLQSKEFDGSFYYTTRYGSPLAYSWPLEVLAQHGLGDLKGKRVLDFGYGGIGHLRLMALAGADCVGVEVDPLLKAYYSEPGDTGELSAKDGGRGRLTLVHGRWPAEPQAKDAVGGGYDLIISKNTLKHGYIHPAQSVDPKMLVDLGVDDETFVRALFDALKPGGRVLIYNLCPAPAPEGKPYIPWADGRSPFSEEDWEKAGFRVLAFDVDHSESARVMGHALGWDAGGMDLKADLFAWYTLVERPKGP